MTERLPDVPEDIEESTLTTLEKIENAFDRVKGLEEADTELDELASMAMDSFKDLHDRGLTVEPRHSAEILAVAGTMLGHAITAKTAKINKKLKQLDLMLKKAQLDQKVAEKNEQVESTPVGEGQYFDRNELLKALTNRTDNKS